MKLMLLALCVAAASARFVNTQHQRFTAPAPQPQPFFNRPQAPFPPELFAAPSIRAPIQPHSSFLKPIQRDCIYNDWTEWSACPAQCGQVGYISRSRAILKEASGYGQKCDQSTLFDQRQCEGIPCPARDCEMTEWSAWSVCSAQCDQGQRNRWRQIVSQPENGGAPCRDTEETEACYERPCAVHCEMSAWSLWSECSADCDEGRRQRIRNVIVQPKNGGRQCGPQEEWENCNNRPCPQDCSYSAWAAWNQCPACGQAQRSRSRSILVEGKNGGRQCDFSGLSETESCNIRPCAVDCETSFWASWTRCSATCGSGRRSRTRSINVQAAYGGQQCPALEEWEACNERPCQVDCQMSLWSEWSDCSAPCDQGKRQRIRNIAVQPLNGGLACPPAEEWADCNNGPCAQDCEYSNWASWSQCPACGQAQRDRSRSIRTEGKFGGVTCDFAALFETEQCNTRPCPVDCVQTQWSQYSECSATCGEGRRQRIRNVITQAAYGGQQCGPAEEWETCNDRSCEVHCEVSQWTAWSACSADCGPGSQQRLRSIAKAPANGGELCPDLEEWRKCNQGPCNSNPPTSYGFAPPAPAPVAFNPQPARSYNPQPAPAFNPQPPQPSLYNRISSSFFG